MVNRSFFSVIIRFFSIVAVLVVMQWNFATADNPIVQTVFTPDPAPMVHNDTLYVYTGRDEENASFFTMYEWRVYSTIDMVNWTDHGSPLSYRTFSWASEKAWAAQAIYRDGKFYWYVTAGDAAYGLRPSIGVAVSESPVGPFRDAIGRPLISTSWEDIDPTVLIDTDGQAYLYWGNPRLNYVRLNRDMVSYDGGIQTTPMTTASFGTRTGDDGRTTTYEEGPWIFKRNALYYIVYPTGPLPEKIAYSTAPTATGPWTYRGEIMSADGTYSFTNHPGIIEYKGKSYFFYHTGLLPGGGGFARSTAVESFEFNADGTIPQINMSTTGPDPIANLNPFRRVEAETIAFSRGLKSAKTESTGVYITEIHNGDYIKVRSVDLSSAGADTIIVSAAASGSGGTIEIRIGSQNGRILGTITVGNTGGNTNWQQFSAPLSDATGINDLYFLFKGTGSGELFNFDWWQMLGSGTLSSSSSNPQSSSSAVVQTPYSGITALPGTLEMENYDLGGPGVAYQDSDPANNGTPYRNDGVDILGILDEGYALGYLIEGEWTEYTVNVLSSGPLSFLATVASAGESGAFHLEIDGSPISQSIPVPNTTSWDIYQTVSGTTQHLAAGEHVLRFVVQGSYFNVDKIIFSSHSPVRIHKYLNKTRTDSPWFRYNLLGRALEEFQIPYNNFQLRLL